MGFANCEPVPGQRGDCVRYFLTALCFLELIGDPSIVASTVVVAAETPHELQKMLAGVVSPQRSPPSQDYHVRLRCRRRHLLVDGILEYGWEP